MLLSSVDTIENNSEPTPADAAHTHEGPDHEHAHEHPHEHAHGPVLNPDCTRELVLDVPAEEVSKSFSSVTRNYQKHAKIPGFRPGKVPEAVVKRRFCQRDPQGSDRRPLARALQPGGARPGRGPVGQPQVTELTVEDGTPLHVKAVFEYIPAFSIEGYQDVTVPKPSVEITEEEFKQELDQLRESRATIEPVEEDRALVDGDWAQITYTGNDRRRARSRSGGRRRHAGRNRRQGHRGGIHHGPAWRQARPGLKSRQTIRPIIPKRKLAGKTVDYDIEVKGIKKRTLPELNDEFAKEIGAYENLADLENRVREHLANRKRRSVEGETKDKLFAALIERFPFPVPESLVQEQIDARLERGLRALAAQGMDTEQMRKLDFAPPARRPARQRRRRGENHAAAGANCPRRKCNRQRRGNGSRDSNRRDPVARAGG